MLFDQLIIGMNMNNLFIFDLVVMIGNEVVGIVVNFYDLLVEFDFEQFIIVRFVLVKFWDISFDGKILIFYLCDDVKFYFGNLLIVVDVVWLMWCILYFNLVQVLVWKFYGFSKKNIDSQVSVLDCFMV